MKKIVSGFLAVVLMISFVCCVYLHGTDQKFSPYLWFSNVADLGELISFRKLMDIWTRESYWRPSKPPDNWAGSSEDEWLGMEEVFYDSYDGDNDIIQFFVDIRALFLRCYHTVVEMIKMLLKLLSDIEKLFPWTATVPRGG